MHHQHSADLLFEIGTEEIPAGYLEPAYSQIKDLFRKKSADAGLNYTKIEVLGTPRRLALIVHGLAAWQKDLREEFIGPSKQASYDNEGNLTAAAKGFARSKGVEASELHIVDTPKGEYLMLVRETSGKKTSALLPEILNGIISALSFPKSMRWANKRQSFARPIQWITALYGDSLISLEHEGIQSSNTSYGHRFLSSESFVVINAENYQKQLLERNVIVDQNKRRQMVLDEITKAVAEDTTLSNAGGRVAIDDNLVDTITGLVEIPVGICGSFNNKFLKLAPEVLITSMREHQKYFPIIDATGQLLPGFVAVNNTKVHDKEITRKGHQRVLRARLEDALFFFNSDCEKRLESQIDGLSGIIFQAKLGTMLEKKERLTKLVQILCNMTAQDEKTAVHCKRASELCKADLLSDMVGEFPSLQGVMGAAYAKRDGEPTEVVHAIGEHYMPKRAGEPVPSSDAGAILALADRFDTLAGCFGIGLIPSGTVDPFGLRRITLAILHIIEKHCYSLSLREIIVKSLALYGDKVDSSTDTVQRILSFIEGRFINDKEKKGLPLQSIEAAIAASFDNIVDCCKRIEALEAMKQDNSFTLLAGSYKRIKNITKENKTTEINTTLFSESQEKELYEAYQQISTDMRDLVSKQEYNQALALMLVMKEPVDNFFEAVMVMAEDANVRQNRLNLLTALGELILLVGDISRFEKG